MMRTKETIPTGKKTSTTPASTVLLDSWCFGAVLHAWFDDPSRFDSLKGDEHNTAAFVRTCKLSLFILKSAVGGVCSVNPATFLKDCTGIVFEQFTAVLEKEVQLEGTL